MSVSNEGWTVTAEGERGVLTIAHDRLGTVVRDARPSLEGDHGPRSWPGWSVEKKGTRQLLVRTTEPRTTWVFDLGRDALTLSSTSTAAVLTGKAPAPADRVVARLLDPRGVPVDWSGTAEVAHGYGGSYTKNPSFLPSRNPDVMYFALGQVSASTLHELFDRKTDTAIRFSDETRLDRSQGDPNVLDVAMPVPGSAVVRLLPDYYKTTLGVPSYVPFDETQFPRPPMVWCSWTSYYADVKEEDIVRNVDWIAEHLKPYGFQYVQLDDGYDRGKDGEHYWIERWDKAKFPHGPAWLASHVKAKGLHPGLWLVPNAYAGAVEQHPDWYLRDKEGRIIRDYNTPALDSSHPEVLAFLRKLFGTLRDWGFEYYKFDGEHAMPRYVPAVDKSRLHDPAADPINVYRRRLQVIREAIGPGTFVEGCPAGTPLNGVGFFNSYFDGDDVYNSWQGMYALFSSINANAFWNRTAAYVMPGEGIEVGPPMTVEEAKARRVPEVFETARTREEPRLGFGTTLAEARTLVSYLALTGVAYPVASVMPELPDERVRLLKMTLPTMPILPVDLFSRGTDMRWDRFKDTSADDYIHNYPEVLDLKVNAPSGTYDVVGATNWRGETAPRTLSFPEKLGLRAGTRYVVFDFWAQKLLGVFTDTLPLQIEPHETRVVLVHPLLARPQLVGTSRHVTGAYSVESLEWDASAHRLRGSSRTVPGDDYSLFLHVPEGMAVSGVDATAEGGGQVAVAQETSGPSLKITFRGRPEPIAWQIEFRGQPAKN